MKFRAPRSFAYGLIGLAPLLALACGSKSGNHASTGSPSGSGSASTSTGSHTGSGGSGSGGSTGDGLGGGIGLGGSVNHGPVESISISPSTATLNVTSGSTAAQAFQVTAHYMDNTSGPADGVTWSATGLAIGSIDGGGTFTANGMQGGDVQVTATVAGLSASAALTVTVQLVSNPGGVDPASVSLLQAASTPDPTVVLAYPYDGMNYPRGVGEPPLMWNNGAATDTIYVHLVSNGFELQSFQANVAGRYDFDPTIWSAFAQSSSGAAKLTVARLAAGATSATVVASQTWTIAPGAMRGTIYYWAINTGRVMRIKPGATAPDDFIGASVTCPACHTVSANGSHLVMNEGSWPDETSISYNLGTNANDYSGLYTTGGASQWALAGVSADGSTLVQNFAQLRGAIGVQTGAFDSVSGAQLPSTGLEGTQLFMPAFSADGKLLVYVTSSGDLHAWDWDPTAKKASNDRLIIAAGSNSATKVINAPTVSPDHQWVIYQRSNANGSLGNNGNLYMASVATPGTEVALDQLNGANYPFAAGARDQNLSFEPTFAPVAAGGYFWVVFHSRRTFGNALTGPAYVAEGNGVKQLWVAAIDQAPTLGKDPSHPAFWLPGQDLTTLNMRGYWALPPCEADGMGCTSGTDCCGGFCDSAGDSGTPVCKSSSSNGCSSDGDHCDTAADCCNATDVCINNVCSTAPPT
jgi:hypothetical protein